MRKKRFIKATSRKNYVSRVCGGVDQGNEFNKRFMIESTTSEKV